MWAYFSEYLKYAYDLAKTVATSEVVKECGKAVLRVIAKYTGVIVDSPRPKIEPSAPIPLLKKLLDLRLFSSTTIIGMVAIVIVGVVVYKYYQKSKNAKTPVITTIETSSTLVYSNLKAQTHLAFNYYYKQMKLEGLAYIVPICDCVKNSFNSLVRY